jgi:hypothetical protein
LILREVSALLTGPSGESAAEASLCSGVLSIRFREASFDPRVERTWTGDVIATEGEVVQQAPRIVLTRSRFERAFNVVPMSLGCWLVLIDDRNAKIRRTANVRLASVHQRWRVRRALRAGGFQVDEPQEDDAPGSTALSLDLD